MIGRFSLFPEAASTVAGDVDALYFFLVGVSGFFSLLIATAIVVLAVRFRRSAERQVFPTWEGMLSLELTWTIIPLLLVLTMFFWGARIFITMHTPPENALQVYVVGKQWMWKVQHVEGRREINELHVPVGRPVKLIMTSEDVIHSFFVPAFRVKQDAVPGRYTSMWFEATKPGTYHLFCAEYCGSQHSRMIGRVVAMEPAEFQTWLSGATGMPQDAESMAAAGRRIFEQLGCATCHQPDSGARGPALAGLFERQVSLADGRTVVADEAYLRESILNPQASVVAGYQPIMPTFKGLVSEEGLLQLIAYIKSLEPSGVEAEPVAPGSTHASGGHASSAGTPPSDRLAGMDRP
jgi:cytochrome c oxidase subunit 2